MAAAGVFGAAEAPDTFEAGGWGVSPQRATTPVEPIHDSIWVQSGLSSHSASGCCLGGRAFVNHKPLDRQHPSYRPPPERRLRQRKLFSASGLRQLLGNS